MMKRKTIAGVAAALLALGGVVAVAPAASAHTSKVEGVAACQPNGTYDITWTYNATNVPDGVEAETKAMTTSQGSLAPIDGVDKGGQVFLSVWSEHQVNVPGAPVKTGNWSGQFKTVGVPGDYVGDVTTMVQTDWLEGPSEDPVGTVTIPGDCTIPEEPEPPVLNECSPSQGTHSTNVNPLWQNVDTRSAGHYEYIEDGLHVWTDDASSNAKVSLGQALSFPLHDTGVIDLAWSGSTPAPGVNLFVNFGADGNGTLVYESVYGQDLWLTNGSSATVKANAPVNGGGNGSQWHGTIDEWLSVYPEAQVTGIAFSLGSGVKGDGVISSITVGCATHTFDYEREVPPAPETPEPTTVTTYSEWEGPAPTCAVQEVEHTRTKTVVTTTYGWAWNAETWTWDATSTAGEPVVTTETQTVSWEGEDCPVLTTLEGPSIVDECGVINDGGWLPGTWDDETQTSRLDNVTYYWEDISSADNWNIIAIVDEGFYVEETEGWKALEGPYYVYELSNPLTDEACPTATPTPTNTPTTAPVVPASSGGKTLAVTGGNAVEPWLPIGAGFLILGGIAAALIGRRRTSTN